MEKIFVHLDNPQKRTVMQIVDVLNNDGVVLLPGDTSYLLAAKIGSKKALETLDIIKANKKRKFYSILFRDLSILSKYTDINDQQYAFIKRLLPGPYTIILKASKQIPKVMLEKRKEIGIRIPDSQLLQAVLSEMEVPLIVSTAVRSGSDEFFNDPELDDPEWLHRVDLIADGGYVASELTTIIHLIGEEYEILRIGKGSFGSE